MVSLTDLLILILLFFIFWQAKPVRLAKSTPSSDSAGKTMPFFQDFLSPQSGGMLRGAAAITVMLHHLSQQTQTGLVFHEMTRIGFLAVSVFFFLSGYGLMNRHIHKEDYHKHFLRRRLPGVVIPYLFVTVLCYLQDLALTGRAMSPAELLLRTFEKGDPIVRFSWYMIVIIGFYLVFFLLMKLFRRHFGLILLGATVCCGLYIALCIQIKYGSWWFYSVPTLLLGMLFAWQEERIVLFIRKMYYLLTPLLAVAFLILFCYQKPICAAIRIWKIREIVIILTCLCFIAALICLRMKLQLGNPILGFFGKISLELYLIHGFFLTFFCVASDKALTPHSLVIENELLYCLAIILPSIGCAYLWHRVRESLRRRRN